MDDDLRIKRALAGLYPEEQMARDSLGKERLAQARARVSRMANKITGNLFDRMAYEMAARDLEKAGLMLGYERGVADGAEIASMFREGGRAV